MTVPENSESVQIPPMYKRDSSLAVSSLVCGLLGWTFIPFFGALAAVITGHLAKKEIRENKGSLTGDGMAVAGLVLGYTQLGLIALAIICIVAFAIAVAAGASSGFNSMYSFLPNML
jgi:hypothetical protein